MQKFDPKANLYQVKLSLYLLNHSGNSHALETEIFNCGTNVENISKWSLMFPSFYKNLSLNLTCTGMSFGVGTGKGNYFSGTSGFICLKVFCVIFRLKYGRLKSR